MSTPERYANHLAFLCRNLTDPELHEHAPAVHRAHGRVIETLLADALSAHELRDGTDTGALARTMRAVIAGAGPAWALDRDGTLPERLRDEIGAVLAPHIRKEESWGN
jgi:hypothetical protein